MFCDSFLCYRFKLFTIHYQRVQQSFPLISRANSPDVYRMCSQSKVCLCTLISELSLCVCVCVCVCEGLTIQTSP